MRNIIYDVAASLDGFIAGPGGDVSLFPHEGDHVADYLKRLESYGTVIMGRSTYEFGYQFGLKPGKRAYPHMDHHIFSSALTVPDDSDVTIVRESWLATIERLRNADNDRPIYLCGGGAFAGWCLSEGLIDKLIIKRAPIVLASGVALFDTGSATTFTLEHVKRHSSGVVLEEYSIL